MLLSLLVLQRSCEFELRSCSVSCLITLTIVFQVQLKGQSAPRVVGGLLLSHEPPILEQSCGLVAAMAGSSDAGLLSELTSAAVLGPLVTLVGHHSDEVAPLALEAITTLAVRDGIIKQVRAQGVIVLLMFAVGPNFSLVAGGPLSSL